IGCHVGDVKLLGVNEGVVHLRLEGSCHSCPSSTVTMKLAIERAIEEAAPEVVRIEVEGASSSASAGLNGNGTGHESNPTAREDRESNAGKWITLDNLPDFSGGNLAPTKLSGARILLCRIGETFYAYRASCPSGGSTLGRHDVLGS